MNSLISLVFLNILSKTSRITILVCRSMLRAYLASQFDCAGEWAYQTIAR
jgi:hypothetical protein